MIAKTVELKDLIVAPGTDKYFIDANTREYRGIYFTAALMKADLKVYVIAHSTNLKPPIVCKINPTLDKLMMVRVSPTLRQLLCINEDYKCEIVSLSKFLDFVTPQHIEGFCASDEFSLSALGFVHGNTRPGHSITSYSANYKIMDAFWFEPSNKSSYIVFVEENGLHVLDVKDSQMKSATVSEVAKVCHRVVEDKVYVMLFTPTQSVFAEISYHNGEISIATSQKPSFKVPTHCEFGYSQLHFLTMLIGSKFVVLNSDFEVDTQKDFIGIRKYGVTEHFLWTIQKDGTLRAQFQNSPNSEVIMRDVVDIIITDVAKDEAVICLKNKIINVAVQDTIDSIFTNLIFEKRFDEAVFIGDGLGLNIPFLFQYVINKHIKEHNLQGALQILEHPKCDLRDSLLRILQEGSDRLALHLALRFSQFQKTIPLIANRVMIKFSLFESFKLQFSKIFQRKELLVPVAEQPPALIFRNQMNAEVEDMNVDILLHAAKIDIPKSVIFSFSHQYIALLSQLAATKDTVEVDIDVPPSIELQKYNDSWIYMDHRGRINMNTGKIEAKSFVIRKNTFFSINKNMKVCKTELPRIDFIELEDVHPTIKIVSNGESVVFLSVSGSIFFEEGEPVVGSYVDVALGSSLLYGLDEHGSVYRIVDRKPEKVPMKHAITAIAAAGNYLIAQTTKNKIVTRDSVIDFKCHLLKNIGDEAVAVGPGELLVFSPDGRHRTITFSNRIGRVLDVTKDTDGSFVLCGSFGSPMKILHDPIPTTAIPSMPELKILVASYSPNDLLALFTKPLWRSFLMVLMNQFGELGKSEHITLMIPYLSELDPNTAAEVMHALISQGNFSQLPADSLNTEYARRCFLAHNEDIKYLTKAQMCSILPQIHPPRERTTDSLSMRLLQSENHSTVVPSLRFKEGRLFVFSCGHILNKDEMLSNVTETKKLCASKRIPATGQYIFDTYLMQSIPAQCPRCLQQRLQAHLRPK